MVINVRDLLDILDILGNRLKEVFGDTIDVDEDYYWQISLEQLFDPLKDPDDITLGQLSEDWTELKRLQLVGEESISYDLIRLAAILNAVNKQSYGQW